MTADNCLPSECEALHVGDETFTPDELREQAAGPSSLGIVWLILACGGIWWLISAMSR
jgi:hypothetical protein